MDSNFNSRTMLCMFLICMNKLCLNVVGHFNVCIFLISAFSSILNVMFECGGVVTDLYYLVLWHSDGVVYKRGQVVFLKVLILFCSFDLCASIAYFSLSFIRSAAAQDHQ